MTKFYTCGQVARKLHVSISTLKRWIVIPELKISDFRNYNGWRLFIEKDIEVIKEFMKEKKKHGRRFKESTLKPIFTQTSKTVI